MSVHDALDALALFQAEPWTFVRQVLRVEPSDQQLQALHAIAQPGAKVSIRSGHGTGKTATLAWIIHWFLSCFSNCKIPCTAPTSHQLEDILWSELKLWHYKMAEPFKSAIDINSERAFVVGAKETDFAVPRTARAEKPEALQGFHAENLLILGDEASGIPDPIFEVAEGALTNPNSRVLLAGNPTRSTGYFYDSHHKDRGIWSTLHFSCLDSPLVGPKYAERMAKKYGLISNIYRVRVLGDFPRSEDDQFIPLEWLEGAAMREVKANGPVVWGLDPARFGGDETVLSCRQGDKVQWIKGVRGFDTMQVVGWVLSQHRGERDKPDVIYVDSIGLGAGIADRLRELKYPVIDVNVSESPSCKSKYPKLRDELWGNFRDWLETLRVQLPNDEDLLAQASTIKYSFDSAGRTKIEGKDELKKRQVSSPDRADSVCLTFFNQPLRPNMTSSQTHTDSDWNPYD